MNRLITLGFLAIPFLLTACSANNTIILTQNPDIPEEKADIISSHYSLLVDVQDDISRKYDILSYIQKYNIRDTARLGNTTPLLNWHFCIEGAQVNLNYSLFSSVDTSSDDKLGIYGLVAHELAHAQHYKHFSKVELLRLGLRYKSYLKHLQMSRWADWVRSYERFTDLQTMAYGYSKELIEQKRRTLNFIIDNNLGEDQLYENSAYLTPDEIIKLSNDKELFDKELQQQLTILKWPIFKEIAEKFPG